MRPSRRGLTVLLFTLSLGIAGLAHAQRPPAPSPQPLDPPTAPDTSVVAPGAPQRDYLAEIRAAFTPENRAYNDLKTKLHFLSPIVGMLLLVFVLFSGLSARMRDVAHAMGSRRYVRVLVYLAMFTILMTLLDLPLSFYDDFVVEHAYGLSNQHLGAWLGDQGKGVLLGIGLLGIVPIVWLAYTLIAKSPTRWWLWLGLVSLPLIAGISLITPIVIQPLFDKATPLQDKVLERRILDLAARADIPGRKVFQVDKSKDTKKYNAFVSGFGASQRIVLWDTMLGGMEEDEILFVMGHEMGHYKLGHVWKGIFIAAGVSLALFFGGGILSTWAMRKYGHRWGFDSLADVASMPLLLLTVNLISFIVQPLVLGYTRRVETEADVYGLEITRDNDAAARAFLKLGSQNKDNPEPSALVRAYMSHPPDGERVKLALDYHPWAEGKPNRFYKEGPASAGTR